MNNWMTQSNNVEEIVLSTRIRLARNMTSFPFPHKLNKTTGREVVKAIEDVFYNEENSEKYNSIYLWENSIKQNLTFLEKHLISKKLIANTEKAAFIVNRDETVSIMINEEDHVRLQCITSGFDLEEAYEYANKIDDILEEKLQYAFDENLGYLTSCPTNIGTGMRASVMLHLPALSMSEEINKIISALPQVGMTIRGIYGEGSKANGNIYQVSNQVTLGLNEGEIVNNLKAVVTQIMNQERLSRDKFIENYKEEIEDKVFRALGILKSARLLSNAECLKLLSDVRLGVEMGIIKDIEKVILNSLIVDTQPAMLQMNCEEKLSDKQIQFIRAKLIREKLNS